VKVCANSKTEFLVRRFVVREHLVTVSGHESLERITNEHEREVVVEPVSDLRRRVGTERFDVVVHEPFAVHAEEVQVSGALRSQFAGQREQSSFPRGTGDLFHLAVDVAQSVVDQEVVPVRRLRAFRLRQF